MMVCKPLTLPQISLHRAHACLGSLELGKYVEQLAYCDSGLGNDWDGFGDENTSVC